MAGRHSLNDYRESWPQVLKSGLVAVILATSCVVARAGTLNDYNPHDVDIPDAGSSVNSDLSLSGAPAGATITSVDVYYEIRHTSVGDLKVWLTSYYGGEWHDLILRDREGGASVDIEETQTGLSKWNGASPNQTWYLVAQDQASGDVGHIDFFELWVSYADAPEDVDATVSVDSIGSVEAGTSVSIAYDVTNDGSASHAFGVGAEILKGGVSQDDVGSQTTAAVSPGNSTPGSFSYSIPSTWSGSYVARCAVWSGTPGASTWLDSYDRSFTVTPAALSLNGRIAYHSYSGYLATPINSTDGHIFVYRADDDTLSKVTSGHPVKNAMNPHFSPDGRSITFMAVPETVTSPSWTSLEVYVLDLASSALTRLTSNSLPDEDPKYSPDGQRIVWKRNGQIWRMEADGASPTQLTSGGLEKSGPNYSPDGSQIAYWRGTRSAGNEDIWLMSADGSSQTEVVANADVHDYYPIFRDGQNILYTRGDPSSPNDDKIYNYSTAAGTSSALSVNQAGANDSDAAPVDDTYLAFCSTRAGGGYDAFVGRYDNGVVYTLPAANSSLEDLGPTYSRYTYARTVEILAPAAGSDYEAGESILLTVRPWSDGAGWTGVSPYVTLSGPTTVEYAGLRDDGTLGDVASGDGIYSKTIVFPSQEGNYTLTAGAESVEPGVTREVSAAAITIALAATNSPPTDILLSSTTVGENLPTGTTVGTLSTADPDTGDTFTYALVSGAGSTDNGAFSIAADQLITAAMFDYENQDIYSIRVRTTDIGGLSYEEAIGIAILDTDETPTILGLNTLDGSNIILRWSSITNNEYSVCTSTGLMSGFSAVCSNIAATPPGNSHTDTVHGCKQKFWRITVEEKVE